MEVWCAQYVHHIKLFLIKVLLSAILHSLYNGTGQLWISRIQREVEKKYLKILFIFLNFLWSKLNPKPKWNIYVYLTANPSALIICKWIAYYIWHISALMQRKLALQRVQVPVNSSDWWLLNKRIFKSKVDMGWISYS